MNFWSLYTDDAAKIKTNREPLLSGRENTHTQAPGRFPKATEKQTRELSSVIRVDWVVMKDVSK